MAQNKSVTLGPVALTTTLTTNLFSPPTLTGGTNPPPVSTNTFYLIKHIRVLNKTASAATFTLYKDATGGNTAGKEIEGALYTVPANGAVDIYPVNLRLSSDETDKFIVGGASANTTLVIQAEAEMGIV